jgi:hypothetical protein
VAVILKAIEDAQRGGTRGEEARAWLKAEAEPWLAQALAADEVEGLAGKLLAAWGL